MILTSGERRSWLMIVGEFLHFLVGLLQVRGAGAHAFLQAFVGCPSEVLWSSAGRVCRIPLSIGQGGNQQHQRQSRRAGRRTSSCRCCASPRCAVPLARCPRPRGRRWRCGSVPSALCPDQCGRPRSRRHAGSIRGRRFASISAILASMRDRRLRSSAPARPLFLADSVMVSRIG